MQDMQECNCIKQETAHSKTSHAHDLEYDIEDVLKGHPRSIQGHRKKQHLLSPVKSMWGPKAFEALPVGLLVGCIALVLPLLL